MDRQQMPRLEMTQKEWLGFNYSQSFIKIYDTKLSGQGIAHVSYPFDRYYDFYERQHSILVYLKSENNIPQQLELSAKVEDIDIGGVTIIPANNSDCWQKIRTVREAILLTIEPQIISRIARENTNLNRIELQFTTAFDPLIQYLALSLKLNLDSGNYDKLYAESLFNTLSMHLLRHYAIKKVNFKDCEGLPPYKLNKAINYIQDNLDRPIKLKDIANLLNINQFYFCHSFKKSTGVAPYKFVIVQRVNKAKQLIKQTKLPLSDIAYECGFSSQSQMTQHFRKSVGVTPKVYRNK